MNSCLITGTEGETEGSAGVVTKGILAVMGIGAMPRWVGSKPGTKSATVWAMADLCCRRQLGRFG